MKDNIMLECFNYQGKVEIKKTEGLKNPRISDLAGKTIGIFWNGKMGGDNFCIAIEELLDEKYPTAKAVFWETIEVTDGCPALINLQ